MTKKRILFVTQEMSPYLDLSEMAEIVNKLPGATQDQGMEIRVLMPRFGVINERRHRLHEVVRLSGMNIIINDDDFPLIIKVASLPGARIQVYFLDNEEFFKRKFVFEDEAGKAYEDNADRMVFFCKGALEIVKKFGWAPDIVHCHGWMTSLLPFYLKSVYKNDPIFRNSKIVYSLYKNEIEKTFTPDFLTKASINNLKPEQLDAFKQDGNIGLEQGAITYSDALIKGSTEIEKSVLEAIKKSGKPVLENIDGEFLPSYMEFYKNLLN